MKRETLGAGRWFPGNKKQLANVVKDYVARADVLSGEGRIVGGIAPHAGYVYSGQVAGHTFRAIEDNTAAGRIPDTVVILGSSHTRGFAGVALMDGDAISSPMGEVELDEGSARQMADCSNRIVFNYSPHVEEHSAENVIPFVQATLPGVKIVVALMGDHDTSTVTELVTALDALSKKKKILVVSSSDMLHSPDYDLVTRTDKATLAKVAAMDYEGIHESWDYSNQVFCGIAPVLAVMQFAATQGCTRGSVLHYRNSGDDFPESRGQWVVGYGSVVFFAPGVVA